MWCCCRVFYMQSAGPSERAGGGGWRSLVKRYSLLEVVFERKRSMASAFWVCCFEVLGPQVAGSSSNSHPRFLSRTRLRSQRPPAAATHRYVDAPWLQIRRAGCDHKSRQKQPNIILLVHSRIQIRVAGCDHKDSQQQPKIRIHIAGGRQKAPQTAK